MTNFCQACGGQRGLHFSTLPGCTCVNPTPINYVINQPIKREWVGLTDEEMSEIIDREIGFNSCYGPEEKFARAIEQALKEKNT